MLFFFLLPPDLIWIGLIFVYKELYSGSFLDVIKPKLLSTHDRLILYDFALSFSYDDSTLTVYFLIYVLHPYQ